MDYALSKALTFGPVSQAPWILFGYDVNCQWSVHYKERFSHAPLLTLPSPMPPLYPAIGTWHVHGHKDRCFPRYATTFIKGAGIRSAEILESRWSSLNKAATALRYMTLPHRAEMLDALMYDCNWKTMVDAGVFMLHYQCCSIRSTVRSQLHQQAVLQCHPGSLHFG